MSRCWLGSCACLCACMHECTNVHQLQWQSPPLPKCASHVCRLSHNILHMCPTVYRCHCVDGRLHVYKYPLYRVLCCMLWWSAHVCSSHALSTMCVIHVIMCVVLLHVKMHTCSYLCVDVCIWYALLHAYLIGDIAHMRVWLLV